MKHLHSALLLLFVGLGACQDPSEPIATRNEHTATSSLKMQASEPIPGHYIAVFRHDLVDVQSAAQALAAKHAGTLKYTYRTALKGMAIQLSDAAAVALRLEPAVEYVEQDQIVHAIDLIVQPGATQGLDRIDQRFLPLNGSYSYSADGTNIQVYVLDTGIHYGHTDFGGRVLFGFDAFGDDGGDCNGHGTHVAGTVGGTTYGVAKKVQLHTVRVLECDGFGTWSGVIAGVDWVTANRLLPAVANMSLGGGFSTAANQAVTNSIAAGVTYTLSAGNGADDACGRSPGSTPNAITVAASAVDDAFASFSSFGSCVDITAPGVSITSAWIGSASATEILSGTSMASPHVAGAAALFLSTSSNATPAQVAAALLSNATPGVLTFVPPGTPNLLLHTNVTAAGLWNMRAALPSPRRGPAVAVANGLLHTIGGLNSAATALSSVVAYNPSTNAWTTKASLPGARQGIGAATISTTIYVAGGHDAAGALTRTLYAYNASTNTWSTRASMPVVGGCGGSAVIGGKLYVFSGCTRSSTGAQVAAGLLHRYDPRTNVWTTLRAAPVVHVQPAVGVISGKLYVVGGNNGTGVANGRLDVYNPATNTWATRATMPTARVTMAGAVVGGKLHVIGGRNGTTYLNAVEAYNPVTNTWAAGPGMPTARAGLGVGAISNLIYAVGGRNASVLATNERYTP